MPADRSQPRVSSQRGGRKDAARALRRLFATRQAHDRNPRPPQRLQNRTL